ncbi:Holliday junction branch migration protein RuvA [Fictibacillus phosphorivorans]|uniref:Holliday junction branch migration protein RuvA n=1 Tax=Fictibacillus phosphorivorans TaxID=1221500 RepID=UPI00203C5A26|nr:Holliday junction branch migration protein RuvA [Fictibacillus phosphorivorans]MCM3716990.1 Holliday junction branch migration protein RuvA [Fictibacillus phosphorivorans]MCM3774461.1 Holliday junction branch migration protein RuvA [Fictibacillus phosphorivorans]
MIESITGNVEYITAEYIVINNNGIGYKIICPNPFIYKLNEQKTVYTYHYVREDVLALYGFINRNERDLFLKLLNVSGIGPKGALAIVAFGQPEQVVNAIEHEDEKFLTKFPGVGKKTARQMILDLKGKLSIFTDADLSEGLFAEIETIGDELDEAVEALTVLGYGRKEIQKVLPELKKEKMSANEYVKAALKKLMNA